MKTFLKVFIVDDEVPIRDELKMFNWEAFNTKLVGEAENGKKALDLCRECVPDIVITDITMPVMDGLELFDKLKAEFPHIQVIVLTCHSDFLYAREALRLGAIEYILKVTMEDSDIIKALDKAEKNIQRESALKRGIQEKIALERCKLLGKIINGYPEKVEEYFKQLGFTGLMINLPLRLVRVYINCNQQNWMFISKEIQEGFYEKDENVIWIPTAVGEYILFFRNTQTDIQVLYDYMEDVISSLDSAFENNLSFISEEIRAIAIISEEVRSYEGFLFIYKETEQWKNLNFYNNDNRVFSGKPVMLTALKGQVLSEISNKLKKLGANKIAVYELQKIMNEERKIHAQVRLAQKLIDNKMKEPISLKSISEEVGLSPNYLSRLFTEDIGESFNEYLTRKRIEKAIELLKASTYKVYEVAEAVGIPSYRYFSVLFKEQTGVTPKEYKKQ